MARTVSHLLPGGRLRRSELRRFTRRALVLLLVMSSANPTLIWADPSASSFAWRTPAVATADADSAGPELAAPIAAPAAPAARFAMPVANISAGAWNATAPTAYAPATSTPAASTAGDSGKLRWRQSAVKQESEQVPAKNAVAKREARKSAQPTRFAETLSAPAPEDDSQTSAGAPAERERFAPTQTAKRFRSAAPPANNDDETVIRLTVGAGPTGSTPEESSGVQAAVAEAPATLSDDEPISNFETRSRTRAQVLGYGRETRVRFAPEQTDDSRSQQSGSPYAEDMRAQYIAQQPRSRVRNRQAPQEPAPTVAPETQPGAAETQPGNLPATDNDPSTDRFQLPEPAPGDAMTPSAELPGADAPSTGTPNAELPDPSLNLPNDSSLPNPNDFSPLSPRTDLYGEPGPSDVIGAPPPPTAQEALEPSPCEGDKNGCVSALEKLQANTIDHIALDIRISGAEGRDFPCECTFGDQKFAWRDWSPTVYTFKANGQCHKPMYFEDVQLERYGHAWNPLLQPVMSGAHFYLNVLLLPYHMGVYPPNECIYTLGYYRPGSCAPFVIEPFPLSVKGALFEGSAIFTGAWVWGFFAP